MVGTTGSPRGESGAPWGVMRVSPGQCVHNAVGGGANANHHSRAVNHRLLGTIWGQTKLGFTLGGHLVVVPRHGVVWAREGGGGAAAGSMVLGTNLTSPWQSMPTPQPLHQ